MAHDAGLAAPARFIASTHWENAPVFAPDGEHIAFASRRSGSEEIWVCDRDGSNAMQVTALRQRLPNRPRWSPDGKFITFYTSVDDNDEIFTVRASGGTPQRVTNHPAGDQHPSFSHDGRWIYFASDRGGERAIWKIPSHGGDAEQVTTTEADGPQESPDGQFLYFDRGWPNQFSVWRVPVGGGEEAQIATSVHPYACWTAGRQGVYWITKPDKSGTVEVRFRGFGATEERTLATLDRPVHWGFTVSPDGRTLLYSQVDEGESDLMLVENFR
ncbi:MAG: hypothetical protein GY953_03315 [bacterium]|nr:hypothetical protein [bacterium]